MYPAIVRTTLLQRQVFPETDLARCDQGRLDVCAPSLGLSLGMRWIWDGSMNHLVSTCRQHVISTIVFLFSHVKTGWFINQKEALNSGPNWWYLMIIHKLKKNYWSTIGVLFNHPAAACPGAFHYPLLDFLSGPGSVWQICHYSYGTQVPELLDEHVFRIGLRVVSLLPWYQDPLTFLYGQHPHRGRMFFLLSRLCSC